MSNNVIYGYRRESERKPSFLACAFLLYHGQLINIGCRDISQTGAGVACDRPLPLHSQIKLAVNTKKKGLVTIEGSVCWCKKTYSGWHSGIRFNRRVSFEPDFIA